MTRVGFLNGPQDSQRPMFSVPKAWRVPGGLRKRGESQGVIPHPEQEQPRNRDGSEKGDGETFTVPDAARPEYET